MRRNTIFLIVLLTIGFFSDVFGQSAKEAMTALKKLQMRCETGILYNDYLPALTEAKTPVMLYIESPASKMAPEFSEALGSALAHYELAGSIFEYMFHAGAGQHFVSTQNPTLFHKIRQAYPELHIYEQKDESGFSYAEAIQIMWTRAASQIEGASEKMPSAAIESTTKNDEEKNDPGQANVINNKLKQQVSALKNENKRLRTENKKLRRELDKRKGRKQGTSRSSNTKKRSVP
jgi:hypothetical protein